MTRNTILYNGHVLGCHNVTKSLAGLPLDDLENNSNKYHHESLSAPEIKLAPGYQEEDVS